MSEKNTVALNERDSSSLLSSCGVRMVASVLLDKPDRAAFEAASRQLGFPVAIRSCPTTFSTKPTWAAWC